jgi:hypothetical protein
MIYTERTWKFPRLLLQFIVLMFIFSCRKELGNGGPTIPEIITPEITVNANIQGFIFDTDNKPVATAVVRVGDKSAVTDLQGLFRINNASVSSKYAVVKIEKTGYFSLTKTLVAAPENDNVIRAQLIPRQLSGVVEAGKGGEVTLNNGAKIKLPANAMIDPLTNASYEGNVNVYMAWMDPSNATVLYQMPGDLRGTTTAGRERMLITYGMIKVELEGDGRRKLQYDSTKPAELTYPVPASLRTGAPATVPMWHFNDTSGRWKQEGEAKLVGSNYVTSVKHFSTWNVDVPYDQPLINYCVYVLDENKKPYLNAHVLIRRPTDLWGIRGYTNADGYLCVQIPMNTQLKLEILGELTCEQAIISTSIGPFTQDMLQETVSLRRNQEYMTTITGTAVDCNNMPITSGYVQGSIRSRGFVGAISDGKFEFTVTRCAADVDLTLFGVDTKTNNVSATKSSKITGSTLDVGKLLVCSSPDQSINHALMAYFPFDGDVQDYSGNGLHGMARGTLDEAADRKGVPRKAYQFDTTDFVYISNSANLNPYPMSVSFWMFIDSDSPGPFYYVLENFNPLDITGFFLQVNNYTSSLGWSFMPAYVEQRFNNVRGESGRPFFKAPFQTGQWVHAVFVVDDSGGKIYMNGKLYGSLPWQAGPGKPSKADRNWTIGHTHRNTIKGRLDEMRIYNRVLLESEIKYLFEN